MAERNLFRLKGQAINNLVWHCPLGGAEKGFGTSANFILNL